MCAPYTSSPPRRWCSSSRITSDATTPPSHFAIRPVVRSIEMAPNAENTLYASDRAEDDVIRQINSILKPEIPIGPAVVPQKCKGRGTWIATVKSNVPAPAQKKCPVNERNFPPANNITKIDNSNIASDSQVNDETVTAVRNLENMLMVMPTWKPTDEKQPSTSTSAIDKTPNAKTDAPPENAVRMEIPSTPASPESPRRAQSDDDWESVYEEYDRQLAGHMNCFANAYDPQELLEEPQPILAQRLHVPEPPLIYVPQPIFPEAQRPVIQEVPRI